jgi:Tol biopolymer transport system component
VISEGASIWPIWTPDGKRIVFSWTDSFNYNIYTVPADGSQVMESLTISQNIQYPSSISPDGNLLAFLEYRDNWDWDIFIYNFRDKSTTPFAATEHREAYPEFSTDGRWIAYQSNEEGQMEVYIRPSSGTGETIKVSHDGGREPLWARSGKKLFYRALNRRQIWAAAIQTEPSFPVGRPRLLFEKSGLGTGSPNRGYGISLDDQRFLMVRHDEREPRPVSEMILIQNWFKEIKRLVPTGK